MCIQISFENIFSYKWINVIYYITLYVYNASVVIHFTIPPVLQK